MAVILNLLQALLGEIGEIKGIISAVHNAVVPAAAATPVVASPPAKAD